MLIVIAGVIVAVGFAMQGIRGQTQQVIASNAGYANEVQARNTANTAIHMALQKINKDDDWYESYNNENSTWNNSIDGAETELWVEMVEEGNDEDLDPDILRLHSKSTYFDEEATVVGLYEKSAFNFVPDFTSAISFATGNFSFEMGGNSNVSGTKYAEECGEKPPITVQNEDSKDIVDSGSDEEKLEGDPPVEIDEDLSYSPVDSLIARLQQVNGVQYLDGNTKEEMGTEEEPGIFFVEEDAKISGGLEEGYGILVIRSEGELDYDEDDKEEKDLDIAGDFEFNGLVIFENAFNLTGRGTPTINGSVLVGHTEECEDKDAEIGCDKIEVDISGNLNINYDCKGEEHARRAQALAVKQNQFKRLSLYEN